VKRLFIAVKVEADGTLLRVISNLKALLGGENIKWVDPGNMHLTLAFLGDTEEKRIKALTLVLKDAVTDLHKFDFTIKGSGVFRNYRDPRVIWAGIEQSVDLESLYEKIKSGFDETGFITEERHFRPHLTLGRIKSIKDIDNLKAVIEKYSDLEIQKVNVEKVILYESILLPTGPLYKPVAKLGLS